MANPISQAFDRLDFLPDFFGNDDEKSRVVQTRDGRRFTLPEEQDDYEDHVEALERQGQPTDVEEVQSSSFDDVVAEAAESAGIDLPDPDAPINVRAQFLEAGVDPDHPELQAIIQDFEDRIADSDPATRENALLNLGLFVQGAAANPEYALPAVTNYEQMLVQSGFAGKPAGIPKITPADTASALRASEGQSTPSDEITAPRAPRFEESDEGWFRHRNGTLISPDGEVVYDEKGTAPGSFRWQRQVVSNWGADKILQEKQRLLEFGYITKEEAKKATISPTFLNALSAFHASRYQYGKPISLEGSDQAAGADAPKPVDLKDLSAEIRNSVREEYRRVYGTEPSDGEVQAWSSYIVKAGMDLQRKFIRKYDSPNTESAVREASEQFIEKLEGSPEAEFLRESTEENTRMRETFDRMAQLTNSLVS